VHFAPIFTNRIKAAGPGKLRAKLTTRTPRNVESLDMTA